jgi:uncharacterized lipoprotein YddW (UPF0748 family)
MRLKMTFDCAGVRPISMRTARKLCSLKALLRSLWRHCLGIPCYPYSSRFTFHVSGPTFHVSRPAFHAPRFTHQVSRFAFASLLAVLLPLTTTGETYGPSTAKPPKPLREFRGAWIATVVNIDWPTRKGMSTADQKAELIALLDRAKQLGLNAVIFQVRPACDAMYDSRIEPWSEFLTGVMGQPPEPFYDPLTFAVQEAHNRGLELHAWFNPYRARHSSGKSTLSPNHISKTHPEYVRQYGKALWLDPGEKAVQDYSLNVVMDVVKRYDIDGIHFDDYFYPYKEQDASGRDLDFPDDSSWRRFGAATKLSRDDWRRQNVNDFIERVYKSIKAAKPWVKFGISPFGIWRPENPPQIKGFDAYAKLYADSRKWLQNGWLDYFAPQLYWAIDAREQSFPVLLKWWAAQNKQKRLLIPGLDATKAIGQSAREGYPSRSGAKWEPDEIANQIRLTRKQAGANGHIHWNMGSLMRNETLARLLQRDIYPEPALMPAVPWLDSTRPVKPTLTPRIDPAGSKVTFDWQPAGAEKPFVWLFQTKSAGHWATEILPAKSCSFPVPGALPDVISLTAIDRTGNGSPPAVLELKKK